MKRAVSILTAGLVLLVCGCSFGPTPRTSASPSEKWVPEREETLPELPPPGTIPPELQAAAEQLTLEQLIDLALRNNERTRISWLRANVASAALRSSKGQFFPNVSAGYELERRKNISQNDSENDNNFSGSSRETSGPFVDLSFLVFDFGRREASVQQVRQALVEANYDHNAVLQSVVFEVIQAFYRYVSLKSLAEAQDITLRETLKNVDYADQRHQAGLATIADVLQAKTAAARAKYARQTTEGQIQALRGLVATAVGLSPEARFEVAPVRLDLLPVTEIGASVEELIAAAQKESPELLAARAEASRASSAYTATFLRRMPSVRVGYRPENELHGSSLVDSYSATLTVSVPVFTGGSLSADIEKARHERDIAESEMRDAAKNLALRVWNDYFAIRTAEQQIATSKELLESAQVSFDVASERYREGVGTILDLLSAEAALQDARAAAVEARSAWLVALAALARDSGKLSTHSGGALGTDYSAR